jgi:hypothetical protein
MRASLFCVVAAGCAVLAYAAQPSPQAVSKAPATKAGTAAKTSPATKQTTAPKTPTATKQAPSKTSSATVHKSTKKAAPAPPVRTASRPRQAQPTPDRYHEIQDALVAKGYLRPEQSTGAWDQNSVDALKRFQAEQKLDVTGKFSALTLIALGLGPKYDAAALPAPPAGQ